MAEGSKKIAIVTSFAPSLIAFRGPLLRALVDAGWCVHVYAPDYDAGLESSLNRMGVVVNAVPMARAGVNPIHDAGTVASLRRELRHFRPDILLSYYVKPVIYGSLAGWLAGVPRRIAMIEGLGFAFTDSGTKLSAKRLLLRRLIELLYRFALSVVHAVVFLNLDDRAEFVSRRICKIHKAHVLGGIGVDLAEWPSSPPPDGVQVTFLFVGRLLKEKGISDFVDAARIVKNKHPQARFWILGEVDSNPGSISRAVVEGWANDGLVEWFGHQPVQPFLEKSSVFVLPSYREGVPRSTQEAMATGRAVVTTDVPGCRDTVEDGVNGFIVPPRNPDSLSEAMLKFIAAPELIVLMGERSREMAVRRFDVHEVNERLMRIVVGEGATG